MAKPTSQTVESFLATLEHPFKQEIVALRALILGASPRIAEGIKWNAPSFHTHEYFATFHLRAKGGAQLILHLGAKKRDTSATIELADPESLLVWLASDRAAITFHNLNEINAKRTAFESLIRAWIEFV